MRKLSTLRLKPRIHPSTNSASAENEAERYALLDKSSTSDLERTEEEILKRFKTELDRVPLAFRQTLPSEVSDDYWTALYYEELQKVPKTLKTNADIETATETSLRKQSQAEVLPHANAAMEPAPQTPLRTPSRTILHSPASHQAMQIIDPTVPLATANSEQIPMTFRIRALRNQKAQQCSNRLSENQPLTFLSCKSILLEEDRN